MDVTGEIQTNHSLFVESYGACVVRNAHVAEGENLENEK